MDNADLRFPLSTVCASTDTIGCSQGPSLSSQPFDRFRVPRVCPLTEVSNYKNFQQSDSLKNDYYDVADLLFTSFRVLLLLLMFSIRKNQEGNSIVKFWKMQANVRRHTKIWRSMAVLPCEIDLATIQLSASC